MERNLDQLLRFDPLAEAERITGDTYKFNESTALLGLGLAVRHNKLKRDVLVASGDTTMSNKLANYVSIIESMGFEKVLTVPFVAKGWSPADPDRNENLFIYAHRDGMLLVFDTYNSDDVNGGDLYYCIKLDTNGRYGVTSSGGYRKYGTEDQYWGGYHDCREALRYNINKLRANGQFLAQWPEDHDVFLWLLHHGDTKDENYDYKAINAERIALLPQWVRTMIAR